MSEYFKKPNAATTFTPEQMYELDKCVEDPFYFIDKFMKVQHPIKGALPLDLWKFQRRIVEGFHQYNKVVALTARQMGKCVAADSKVSVDGEQREIASLVQMTPKQKLVTWLETKLIELAVKKT